MDSAHDSLDTLVALAGQAKVSYIVKWNPRSENRVEWRNRAFLDGDVTEPRPGKKMLIAPEHELDGWWTSLKSPETTVIKLYAGRGASSSTVRSKPTWTWSGSRPGKFVTNSLVLSLAGFVYNMLRIIGQFGLLGPDSPVRHPAKRRRIRTVMQEIMYLAGRLIWTGRSLKLRFGKHCPAFNAFRLLYQRFSTA